MTVTESHKLDDVFGIVREVPLSYTPRDSVDSALIDSLTREKHIVVFGSSKQGKTCVRKYNLTDDDYIVATCSNRWSLSDIHAAILKAVGYSVEQSTTKTVRGSNKITATLGAKLRAWVAEASATAGVETEREIEGGVVSAPLELDPDDVNDIIRALEGCDFRGYIVLEDFHYLPEETQRDFAVALKAFHEGSSYCFIVVGVWLDENRLIQYNGDLTGRVITVNADRWLSEELRGVIETGQQLLNVRFNEDFTTNLLKGCFDSVYIVQEVCYRACAASKVHSTRETPMEIGTDLDPVAVIKEVVNTESARYNAFISGFAEGFVTTELEMYRYLLVPILLASAEHLAAGLSYNELLRQISLVHPRGEDLNAGNLTQALRSTASLQVGRLGIKPIVLDYDQSLRKINVVDRGFLVWLQSQDREELVRLAGLDPVKLRDLASERDPQQGLFPIS